MDPKDKAALLKLLDDGGKAVQDAVKGVSEEMAARPPAPGKWSIIECVEHIAISEDGMFSQTLVAQPAETPPVNEHREHAILSRSLDRTRAVAAPEIANPAGRHTTLHAALQHFLATHERTRRFVETCDGDLRRQLTTHPLIGPVNCYENLLMIAMHPLRHAQQIEECKSLLKAGDPAS
jgi:hypothetical protein